MAGYAMVMWPTGPQRKSLCMRGGVFWVTDLKCVDLDPDVICCGMASIFCPVGSVLGHPKLTMLWWRRWCEASASQRWLKSPIRAKWVATLICCLCSLSLWGLCLFTNNSIIVCFLATNLRSATIAFICPIIWLIGPLYVGCTGVRSNQRQSIPYPLRCKPDVFPAAIVSLTVDPWSCDVADYCCFCINAQVWWREGGGSYI